MYTDLPTIKAEKSLCDGDCHLTAILNPNRVNTLAPLTIQDSLVQNLGPPSPEK